MPCCTEPFYDLSLPAADSVVTPDAVVGPGARRLIGADSGAEVVTPYI